MADAGVIVTSKNAPAGNVEVSLVATGLDVTGDMKRTIALPENGSVEVRFPLSAKVAGQAELTFSARSLSGDVATAPHDEVRVKRTVEVPLSPEAVAALRRGRPERPASSSET